MLTGTTPWTGATAADDYYQSYLCSQEFLLYTLPISKEAAYICQRIFTQSETDSISLAELRDLVESVEEFWMSEEEIAASEDHLQKIARDYRRIDEPRCVSLGCSNSSDSESSSDEFNSLEDDSDDSDEHSNGMRSTSLLAVEEGRIDNCAEAAKIADVPLEDSSSSSAYFSSPAPVALPVGSAKESTRGSGNESSSSYYTTSGSSSAVSGVSAMWGRIGGKKSSAKSSRLGVRRHIKRLFSVAA